MDRAIFNLQASIEATSLYILLCALEDEAQPLTLERASRQWNGTRDGLLIAAEELVKRGVLSGSLPLSYHTLLEINPNSKWH